MFLNLQKSKAAYGGGWRAGRVGRHHTENPYTKRRRDIVLAFAWGLGWETGIKQSIVNHLKGKTNV